MGRSVNFSPPLFPGPAGPAGNCAPPVFFHPDRLGTIDTVTSGGVVVGREKRDPFGRPYSLANMSGADQDVAIGFIGEMEDGETSLVNLNHRLYDPKTGRFLSPDPLVRNVSDGQDYNRYSYAENNPLSFVDPSGLLDTGPPADLLPPPDLGPNPEDINSIVGTPTYTFDGNWSVNYVTGPDPGDPAASTGAGDPTAPYQGLQPMGNGPALPNFGSPPSPSQSFVSNPGASAVGGGGGGGIQSTMLGYSVLAMAPGTVFVPRTVVTTPTPLDSAHVKEIGKESAITLAVGAAPVALWYGWGAFVRWIAAYPLLINFINQLGQGPGTPSIGGASEEVLSKIAQGNSMTVAVAALNEAGATQAQAVGALNQVVANAAKILIPGTLEGAPGTIVLAGKVLSPGADTPAITIAANGVAALGSATVVSLNIPSANPLTWSVVVSNFVSR